MDKQDRRKEKIPRVRISAHVQTGPGTHPASYTMDTESFRTQPDIMPRIKKKCTFAPPPPRGLHSLFYGSLYLYLYLFNLKH
jgi:hypothetical protein